jgi:hypothetical protein
VASSTFSPGDRVSCCRFTLGAPGNHAFPCPSNPRGMCVWLCADCRVAFNSSISRTHAILFRTKARQQLANKKGTRALTHAHIPSEQFQVMGCSSILYVQYSTFLSKERQNILWVLGCWQIKSSKKEEENNFHYYRRSSKKKITWILG